MNTKIFKNSIKNPLSDLINDSTYNILKSRGLINKKSVRDYLIKQNFHELRQNKISAAGAIDIIRKEYPYLQFDTIRKIVYQIQK
jgi:hypothetical protein